MDLPLTGITVLDLTRLLPGPYCTMILADLGAKVIRVEQPNYSYPISTPSYQKGDIQQPIFDTILMRNKYSITVNLKEKAEHARFLDLIRHADVIIEGYRPGVTKKLGIDYKTIKHLNPSIIYCSLTGYGHTGPKSQLPGHDINFVGLSGNLIVQSNSSDQTTLPKLPPFQLSDISGGIYSAIGILGAIIERNKNEDRIGQFIDISMLDCALAFNPAGLASTLASNLKPSSNLNGESPNYTIYSTKDKKYMAVGSLEPKFWYKVCDILDLPELKSRLGQKKEVYAILKDKFLEKTQEEWKVIFNATNACVTPVLDYSETINDAHLRFRNMITEENHPQFGKILNLGTPIKYSRTPLSIRKSAPIKGEDTEKIFKEI